MTFFVMHDHDPLSMSVLQLPDGRGVSSVAKQSSRPKRLSISERHCEPELASDQRERTRTGLKASREGLGANRNRSSLSTFTPRGVGGK